MNYKQAPFDRSKGFDDAAKVNTKMDKAYFDGFKSEHRYYTNLIKFIQTDEWFINLPVEAPDFYKVIASYGHEITKKIGLYVWQPEENEWSCDDLCTIEQVT